MYRASLTSGKPGPGFDLARRSQPPPKKLKSVLPRGSIEDRLDALWALPRTLWGLLATVDHRSVGICYIVTAIVFLFACFFLGGLLAGGACMGDVARWGPQARPDILAAVALIVSALFVAAVAWTLLAQLWLPLCERVR